MCVCTQVCMSMYVAYKLVSLYEYHKYTFICAYFCVTYTHMGMWLFLVLENTLSNVKVESTKRKRQLTHFLTFTPNYYNLSGHVSFFIPYTLFFFINWYGNNSCPWLSSYSSSWVSQPQRWRGVGNFHSPPHAGCYNHKESYGQRQKLVSSSMKYSGRFWRAKTHEDILKVMAVGEGHSFVLLLNTEFK